MYSLLLRHTEAVFAQMALVAVCNRLHAIPERCARWLLMADDRMASQPFYLTQQLFARLQGVLRPTVNKAFRTFQTRGLIRYRRSRMTIVDHPGLAATACECYKIIRSDYERLLG